MVRRGRVLGWTVVLVGLMVAAGHTQSPEYEMTTYYLYLLEKGPAFTGAATADDAALQARHLAYYAQLHEKGRLAIVGPFTDDGLLRGLGVLRADSMDEARGLVEADPAVATGRLAGRIYRWMGPKDWFGTAPQPWELVALQFGFLVRGPKADGIPEAELEKLQQAHLAFMADQARLGRLVMAGPFIDGGDLRGLVVYNLPTLDEARRIGEGDPMITAGRLRLDLHPWMTAKGMLRSAQRDR